MRILIVSNCYPPHFVGGYELGCFDVAESLKARGHDVTVLTSSYGLASPTTHGAVYRLLQMTDSIAARPGSDGYRRQLLRLEVQNQLAFDRAWRHARPDVVYIWNLGKLPISLAMRAEASGKVCYYVSDQWLSRWTDDAWRTTLQSRPLTLRAKLAWGGIRRMFRLAGFTLSTGDLRLRHVQFCSSFMRDATARERVTAGHSEVVHWGIDVERFRAISASRRPGNDRRRLLYVGQVIPHKGVHTAIEALRQLHNWGFTDATLTVAGGSRAPEYVRQLQNQVREAGLCQSVNFIGLQPRESLPRLYGEHDILVFPSCWDEPFAITPLEAMASGLVVVGTTRGGSHEILENGINALTFAEEDAVECATQIRRLFTDAALASRVRQCGGDTVSARFTLGRMVDRIESDLDRVRQS